MNIGQIIKKLRRERDMTQEQLAEYLNISSQAVSRWETELAMPDITSLPMLANIFDVSVDRLLGVDIENKEKKIWDIIHEAREYSDNGHFDKAIKIYRDGLKQYPNSYSIMYGLMSCLRSLKENDEAVKLGEKIVAECTDIELRSYAAEILCYLYSNAGRYDEAVKLAETALDSWTCTHMLAHLYKGNRKFSKRQDNIKSEIDWLFRDITRNNSPLDDGTLPYSLEDEIALNKKVIDILKIMFEDGDYGFFQEMMGSKHLNIASRYAKLGDKEAALEYLEIAKKYSIVDDTEFDAEKKHTSMIFKGMEYGGRAYSTTNNNSLHQLERMNESEFDFIRESSRFKAIADELKKYAKQH